MPMTASSRMPLRRAATIASCLVWAATLSLGFGSTVWAADTDAAAGDNAAASSASVAAAGPDATADDARKAETMPDWRVESLKTPPPRQYGGGGFFQRDTMTGDWNGLRNEMARHGITVDYGLTQNFQGITGGGLKHTWRYQGSSDLVINFDMGKLGLWPGGFLKLHAENRYGDAVNRYVGALSPVNTDSLYPVPGQDNTTLSEVVFMQFLSPRFAVLLGKMELREDNVFASNERTQFMNSALVFNQAAITTAPLDALGAGVLVMPTDWLTATFFVLDSEGQANTSGFDTAFEGGMTVVNKYEVKIKPFGQVGHQRLAWTWSDKSRYELDQQFVTRADTLRLRQQLTQIRSILEGPGRFPRLRNYVKQRYGSKLRSLARDYARMQAEAFLASLPDRATHQGGDWAIMYDFDQYLYTVTDHPDRGFGVFGRVGVTSGEVNPVQNFYSIGVGGKGLMDCRPDDSFGVGYYFTGASDGMSPVLSRIIEDEQGVEIYYSIAITPWMRLTPDLQVIDPSITGVDTAIVTGVRLQIDF